MTATVETRGLTKVYAGRGGEPRTVLGGISTTIAPGEFICLVGASGCGKTTFLRSIGGLVRLDAGAVLIDGRVVTGPGPERGFVFQADSLLPWRRVVDNVTFGLEVQRLPAAERRNRAAEMLRRVGLGDFAEHYPHELSGGMRQRVNLARALAIDPDILLMDEPFAALDAQTREVMQRELLDIWEQRRTTVLFVTHQIDEAIYLADRILVFGSNPGRIRAEIAVPFARPRPLSLKRTAEFLGYVDRIWSDIEADVLTACAAPAL